MAELKEEDMRPGDRYQLIKVKGKGSYGIVGAYLDKKTGQKVAIKRMHKIEDSIDARRMIREIRILHNFRHENIIELKRVIYNEHLGQDFGDIYVVTNLMDVDLSHLIKKNKDELTDEHIQFIVYQIFRALKYLHSRNQVMNRLNQISNAKQKQIRNIIHRDIKPSNILADENCDIRLCDFGFAREENWDQNAMTEYVVTRYYRAPEVMLNSQNYQKAVDVWSVGCTIFELITGKPLFKAGSYLELIKLFIQTLGMPDEETLGFIKNDHAKKELA